MASGKLEVRGMPVIFLFKRNIRPKPHIDSVGHVSDSNLLPGFWNADSSSCAMKTSPERREGKGRKGNCCYLLSTQYVSGCIYVVSFNADCNPVGQILSSTSCRLGEQFERLNNFSKLVQLIVRNFIWQAIEYRQVSTSRYALSLYLSCPIPQRARKKKRFCKL